MKMKAALFIISSIIALFHMGAAATPGCDCASLAQLCAPDKAVAYRHLNRKMPACEAEELKACGMTYAPKFTSNLTAAANSETRKFMNTIITRADEIMELYKGHITPREYTELTAMAFGILGNESSFFQGRWYLVKKISPEWAIELIKCQRRGICGSDHSYGPTQIKKIPLAIQKKYGVELNTLYTNPEHAALATIGFLIEMKKYLYDLKTRYHSLSGLDKNTYVDYLAYFYQGKGRRPLLKMEMPNAADPSRNGYLHSMRNFMDSLKIREYSCPMTSEAEAAPDAKSVR